MQFTPSIYIPIFQNDQSYFYYLSVDNFENFYSWLERLLLAKIKKQGHFASKINHEKEILHFLLSLILILKIVHNIFGHLVSEIICDAHFNYPT